MKQVLAWAAVVAILVAAYVGIYSFTEHMARTDCDARGGRLERVYGKAAWICEDAVR